MMDMVNARCSTEGNSQAFEGRLLKGKEIQEAKISQVYLRHQASYT